MRFGYSIAAAAALFVAAPAVAATVVATGPVVVGEIPLTFSGPITTGPGNYLVTLETASLVTGHFVVELFENYNEYNQDGFYAGGNDYQLWSFYHFTDTNTFKFHFKVPRNYDYVRDRIRTIGGFTLTGLRLDVTDASSLPVDYAISVERTGAIPEPAAWAMMIAGFGLAGAAVRRRKTAALRTVRAATA